MLVGAKELWPEYEDYYHLMEQKTSLLMTDFKHLKLNEAYHRLSKRESFVINVAEQIAARHGINIQIPENIRGLGVSSILQANGLNVDIEKEIML